MYFPNSYVNLRHRLAAKTIWTRLDVYAPTKFIALANRNVFAHIVIIQLLRCLRKAVC